MPAGLRRLLPLASVVLIAIVVVVGGVLAGAATAPSPPPPPLPEASTAPPAVRPDKPDKPAGFRRHAAAGMVLSVNPERPALAVRVRTQEEPVLVLLDDGAPVKIDRRRATIGEVQRGDRVMVFGRPQSDGSVMARAVVVRRLATPVPD